jgi:hypothetical protein
MVKKSLPVVLIVALLALAVPLLVAAQEVTPGTAPRFDRMAECAAAGRGLRGFRFRGGGLNPVEATAQVTGQAPEDVVAALQEGQTLAEIAAGAGATAQAVVDVLLDARAEALAQAVSDGRFTQEQVDTMLEQMRVHLLDRLNAPWEPRHAGNGCAFEGASPRDGAGYRGGQARGKGMQRGSGAANCPNVQP